MHKLGISFYECEHYGDVENCLQDIRSCGGKVIHSELNADSEYCHVTFEVENKEVFFARFVHTNSFDFCNWSQ